MSGLMFRKERKWSRPMMGYLGIISKLLKMPFSIQVHRIVSNAFEVVSECGKSPASMVPGFNSKG
jgi:hypothetical protein